MSRVLVGAVCVCSFCGAAFRVNRRLRFVKDCIDSQAAWLSEEFIFLRVRPVFVVGFVRMDGVGCFLGWRGAFVRCGAPLAP